MSNDRPRSSVDPLAQTIARLPMPSGAPLVGSTLGKVLLQDVLAVSGPNVLYRGEQRLTTFSRPVLVHALVDGTAAQIAAFHGNTTNAIERDPSPTSPVVPYEFDGDGRVLFVVWGLRGDPTAIIKGFPESLVVT
ncbi:MAG: hypothetical protein JNK05_02025 [Myxococcales bacterium]|nr:hypothetical protein [Myxococcales bacterium]